MGRGKEEEKQSRRAERQSREEKKSEKKADQTQTNLMYVRTNDQTNQEFTQLMIGAHLKDSCPGVSIISMPGTFILSLSN